MAVSVNELVDMEPAVVEHWSSAASSVMDSDLAFTIELSRRRLENVTTRDSHGRG